MRATNRQGTARAASEEMSMQHVLEMIRGLQDEMAESRIERERIQTDLADSRARNEELHRVNEELRRDLNYNQGQCEQDETASNPTKGVFHTLLAGDSGCGDPQHVRRAQGDLYRDGRRTKLRSQPSGPG